ncbi:RND transporter, partial [Variovorax sp. Varisp62]
MKFSVQPLVKPLRTALLPLMAALVLAGCATAPSGLPEITTTAQFKEQGKDQAVTPPAGFTRAAPSEAQPRGAWWLAFNDSALNALIEKADVNNTNIQAAAARLAEARALARR